MKGLDDVARDLVQLFEAEGIPYVLMGGLAIRIHAIPRPTDLVDVADVLFIQGQLDEDYLRQWASTLGVSAALEEALRSRDAGR